jgi:hypothetical protein
MLLGNIVYTKHRFTVPKISFKLLRTIISGRRGATTFSITTFSIMTLSIKGLFVTLSINNIQQKRHSA